MQTNWFWGWVGKCECHIQVQARPTGSRAVTPQQRRPALARHGLNPWFQGCCHCRGQVFLPCVYDPQCLAGCAQGACRSLGIMKHHRGCMAAHVVRLHTRSQFLCLLDSATMNRPRSWFSPATRITSAGGTSTICRVHNLSSTNALVAEQVNELQVSAQTIPA